MSESTYTKLIDLLDSNDADYRLIDHEAEGRTELVSKMRGNEMRQAANCIILMVKIGKKEKKYVLSVYPAHKKLDLDAVKDLFGGKYVAFADKDKAEMLAGSVLGTVLPFPFHDDLEFVVDPVLMDNDEIFFNAARLDQSVALKVADYQRIAEPRLEPIIEGSTPREKTEKPQETNDELFKIRHSLSHAMSQAVMELYPDAKRGVGPAIDNGFYQDFDFGETKVHEEGLKKIEKRTKQLLKQNQKFEQSFMPIDEAIKYFGHDPYKVELIEDLKKDSETEISIYTNYAQDGAKKYEDLCKGPHVDQFSRIDPNAFQIEKMAGAYWRGDENNTMLTRIYGVAFETREQLDDYNKMMAEAKKRDHRVLGKKLELFTFDEEVGPGLPLWMPNGAIMVEEIEQLAKQQEIKYGYNQVRTPHITKGELYHKSGHLPYYEEDMFPAMELENGEKYYLKPMNCPHHHKIFDARPRSYRELPIRLAEYGHCYRNEDSGALFGLMRVRSLCMNDAHIYCTEEQFEDEFVEVINMYLEYFELFGIEKYEMRLSKHSKEGLGKKYVDNEELWIKTEAQVRSALERTGVPFVEADDEAAFYGPKIDVQVWSAIGREFTLATNQLDFAVPGRFDLTYIDSDGKEKTPLCIHRAPLSTHERFIGFLIEHFAGIFPLWLAPRQTIVVPVSNNFDDYGHEVLSRLKEVGLRAEIDDSTDGLNKKIRNAEKAHINYILVVGEEEKKGGSVSVRNYKTKEQSTEKLDAFIERARKEIDEKTL